jgi:hypothetical protein
MIEYLSVCSHRESGPTPVLETPKPALTTAKGRAFTMAKDDPTQKRKPITMSVAEIHSLCARLDARAGSFLLRNEAEQAVDLTIASAALRALLRNVNHADIINLDNGA